MDSGTSEARELDQVTSLKKNIFTFDPEDYAEEEGKNGYVLVKNGVHPEVLEVAKEQAAKQEETHKDLDNWHFKGKKRQYLYDFDEWDFYET